MAKVLSIEVGVSKTKICLVDSKKRAKVFKTLVFNTPGNCIEDGYIKNAAVLAEEINSKLQEAKIRTKKVVFTISSSKIANREVIIPLVKESKIQTVINAGIEDYFPIDVTEYNITYTLLEKVNNQEERHYRLLVLAVHNNLILTYYELAKALNFHIKAIDYIGNSIFQMIRKQVKSGINMFIQINKQDTLINILKDDILILQRTVSYGYDVVTDAITENPVFSIASEVQAFSLLNIREILYPRFGSQEEELIAATITEADVNQYEEISAREDVTDSLHYLVNNILRVMDYFTSKNANERIQTIYITGLGSRFLGIEQLFANELGCQTSIMDDLSGISFKHSFLPEGYRQSDFIACVGAVLAPVNMKPNQLLGKAGKRSSMQGVVIICSMAIIVSGVMVFVSNMMLKNAIEKKDNILTRIDTSRDIDKIYNENRNIQYAWITMESIDEYCYNNNEELGNLILELQQKLPSKVVIRSFRAANMDILMDITVDSKETAALTISQLKKVSILTNIKTNSISEQIDEYGKAQVNFAITANYTVPLKEE